MNQEIFRFVSVRQLNRNLKHRYNNLLICDKRTHDDKSLFTKLFSDSPYESKLYQANAYINSSSFLNPSDEISLKLANTADALRELLKPDAPLVDINNKLNSIAPELLPLIEETPDQESLDTANSNLARLWDTLYAQLIRGTSYYISTNYLADGIRVYHILKLLWSSQKSGLDAWKGASFDEYEILIDYETRQEHIPGKVSAEEYQDKLNEIEVDVADKSEIDKLLDDIDYFIANDFLTTENQDSQKLYLSKKAADKIAKNKFIKDIPLETTSVEILITKLQKHRKVIVNDLQHKKRAISKDRGTGHAKKNMQTILSHANANPIGTSPSNTPCNYTNPLKVGCIRPPVVGDLILVEQQLKTYEAGELADINNIMKGEKREWTTKNLNRVTQSSSQEQELEREENESQKTDERFDLSSEASKTATRALAASGGVSVKGNAGPVIYSASASAAYSNVQTSSQSNAQEFSRNIIEESSKKIRERTKQSSSITFMTETLKTSLHGFDNVEGPDHINGLYQWVDKIYTTRTLNYGRRLMLEFSVPEPAAFFRGIMKKNSSDLLDELTPPPELTEFNRQDGLLLAESSSGSTMTRGESRGPVKDHLDINENNYAGLAAAYDVTDINPPPAKKITGSKAISYPESMTPEQVKDHNNANKELSYVKADNSLQLDPDYQIKKIGVFAPKGKAGKLGWYADSLKLGIKPKDENLILVQVGDVSFYFHSESGPNKITTEEVVTALNPLAGLINFISGGGTDADDKPDRTITTNFNSTIDVKEEDLFSGVPQPTLPITISTDFEGILVLTVIYTATLRDEAYEKWQLDTFNAIKQGYEKKFREYEQQVQLSKSRIEAEIEARNYQLRDEKYREIENIEIKRSCIDILSKGSAIGHTSISVAADGTVRTIYDEIEGSLIDNWRSPFKNGSIASFFEESFDWTYMTYHFYPYYWTDSDRWRNLIEITAGDSTFEKFLKAGSARIIVPVKPGYEKSVKYFLDTGLIWNGGYLPLFKEEDLLDIHYDVILSKELDPPKQIGKSWEVKLPTNMILLKKDNELPVFDTITEDESVEFDDTELIDIDDSIPY